MKQFKLIHSFARHLSIWGRSPIEKGEEAEGVFFWGLAKKGRPIFFHFLDPLSLRYGSESSHVCLCGGQGRWCAFFTGKFRHLRKGLKLPIPLPKPNDKTPPAWRRVGRRAGATLACISAGTNVLAVKKESKRGCLL